MISFIETKLSTRLVGELLSDEEYALLQRALIENPEIGDVAPGSGGVRNMRWGISGGGKRGGVRVMLVAARNRGYLRVPQQCGSDEESTSVMHEKLQT